MSYQQHTKQSTEESARCAVITLSDTRTPQTDKSGKRITDLLESSGHSVNEYRLIRDEAEELRGLLEQFLASDALDIILTNGGTGVSRRDRTIEVVQRLLDQLLPGFGEIFRALSFQEIGSGAMLSRAIGGIARGKLLFAMPGSTNAVELAMTKLILPELKHLLHELRK